MTRDPLSTGLRRRSDGVALLFAALAATSSVALAEADGPGLERLATLDLPEEVAAASDVRWREDGAVLLGVGGNGIYSWQIGEERAELTATLAGSPVVPSTRLQNYARVGGFSTGAVAFSSSAYGVFRQDGDGITASKEVEIVGDLDRRHARTAVVGLSRRSDGGWEDKLAWLISDDGTVRGILPRRDEESHWLLASMLGVVRILSEDRVLVLPGLEPDVFIYDWSGRLRDTLETGTFFADSPWKIRPDQKPLLTEPSWSRAWLSRHRLIDEVVADDRGNIFVFVRHVPAELPYPEHVVSGPQGRVTGALTVVGSSGELTPVPLSDEEMAKLSELLEKAGDTGSGEPVRIEISDLERILADSDATRSPERTKVCWDLVHAHVDDLRAVTKANCVVDSEFADARLRADLRGDRAVILLRGDVYGAVRRVRRSEAFEARLIPPNR